jgi:hypothetical protein
MLKRGPVISLTFRLMLFRTLIVFLISACGFGLHTETGERLALLNADTCNLACGKEIGCASMHKANFLWASS